MCREEAWRKVAAKVDDSEECDAEGRGAEAVGVWGAVEDPSVASARGTEEYRTRIARLTRLPPVRFEMAQFMAHGDC